MSNTYPEVSACEVWEKDGLTFSIVFHGRYGHYCGYVRFPSRPVREEGYDGILTYVPVHGGITYAEPGEDGSMVYGFDCAHLQDETNPNCTDTDWLKAECERMAQAITEAVTVEADYLLAADGAERAKILDVYHDQLRDKGINFCLTDNIGVMLNLLGGRL